MYLFTDSSGLKVMDILTVDTREGDDMPGDVARRHRLKLEKQLNHQVIAWVHMGKDNPYPVKGPRS